MTGPGLSPGGRDFADIHLVHPVAFGIPAVEQLAVCKAGGLERRGVELAALERQARLGKGEAAGGQREYGQAGLGHLVGVAPRLVAADLMDAAGLGVGAEEREAERVGLLDEAVGVALGADEDEGHRLVPEPAEAAPRGRHGVESGGSAGRHQHPLGADERKDVVGKFFWINLFQFFGQLLFHDKSMVKGKCSHRQTAQTSAESADCARPDRRNTAVLMSSYTSPAAA